MMRRSLVSIALIVTLAACGGTREGTPPAVNERPAQAAQTCNASSAARSDNIDAIARQMAARAPGSQAATPQEREVLSLSAEIMANTPEGADAQGQIYCRFHSARAANLALREAQADDAGLIDLMTGAHRAVASACAANPGEPSTLHCRQLLFFETLGGSRSVGHPLIVAGRASATGLSIETLEQGFGDFAATTAGWGGSLGALTATGAPTEEQEGARRELAALACHVHEAGARMALPTFGFSQPDRVRIELATRRADAGAARGLGLPLNEEAQSVCAQSPDGPSCALRQQEALIDLCQSGAG